MKDWIRKISVSVMFAVGELLLGVLLLLSPEGLAGFVTLALGLLLIAVGGMQLVQYIRMPLAEAVHTWKLAFGTGMLTTGIIFMANRGWLMQVLGAQTTLYGIIVLGAVFMKVQIAVDALRGNRPFWYLMAISFAVSSLLSILLFTNPFAGNTIWVFAGIVLLIMAGVDAAYYFTGRTKEEKTNPSESKA